MAGLTRAWPCSWKQCLVDLLASRERAPGPSRGSYSSNQPSLLFVLDAAKGQGSFVLLLEGTGVPSFVLHFQRSCHSVIKGT